MRGWAVAIVLSTIVLASKSILSAGPCAEDFKTRVAANGECLVIRTFGVPAEKTTLAIFIHGDTRRVADYMYPVAQAYGSKGVIAVGLIRPGYDDSAGNHSTGGGVPNGGDNYRSDIVETVAAAIKLLKEHYKAEYVLLAGRSGGAALSGIIIGKFPGLVNAVVLGACPCNVPRWRFLRKGTNRWLASLSPHDFVDSMAADAKIVAVTGSSDSITYPVLARDYVKALKGRGIDAVYIEAAGVGHGKIENSSEFRRSVYRFLEGRSFGSAVPPSQEAQAILSRFSEHFTNALARYRTANRCMARDRKDAERIIRELTGAYRELRDSTPRVANEILRASLDNHFQIADVALAMKCPGVADDQYRAIKRILRSADLPAYRERLESAIAALNKPSQ